MMGGQPRGSKPARRVGRSAKAVRRPIAALVIAAIALLSPASAQDGNAQAQFGRQVYGLFCSGCHGADGRGETSITEALDLPAIDLTRIAERNGGVFPADAVAAAISGTSENAGHRKLAMEPWSRMFADEFDDFAERVVVNQLVARRIDHLVEYLRSIQR
jgi:mono/diheme cytochrome c family protein